MCCKKQMSLENLAPRHTRKMDMYIFSPESMHSWILFCLHYLLQSVMNNETNGCNRTALSSIKYFTVMQLYCDMSNSESHKIDWAWQAEGIWGCYSLRHNPPSLEEMGRNICGYQVTLFFLFGSEGSQKTSLFPVASQSNLQKYIQWTIWGRSPPKNNRLYPRLINDLLDWFIQVYNLWGMG